LHNVFVALYDFGIDVIWDFDWRRIIEIFNLILEKDYIFLILFLCLERWKNICKNLCNELEKLFCIIYTLNLSFSASPQSRRNLFVRITETRGT